MKILMVNKFLYPNGGSETYIFELGKQLEKMGHQVQYFGMEHEGRIVGNKAESYTSDMNFHGGGLSKLLYPFNIIYSREARKKIRIVLEDFQPEVVHLNNFNFQLTPSILYEIRKFSRDRGYRVGIVYTAHDGQLVCPNHMMLIPKTGERCFRCRGRKTGNCTKYRCIHGSLLKSLLGTIEAKLYQSLKSYAIIDKIICPSSFMARILSDNPLLGERLRVIHNFLPFTVSPEEREEKKAAEEEYVLYFGRYTREKGMETLLKVCSELKEVRFVFAGSGPYADSLKEYPNIVDRGFLSQSELKGLIAGARFTVFPTECYDNCPFSVMESQAVGTPVIGSRLGGVPELIQDGVTGELFEAGNAEELKEKLWRLWKDRELCRVYSEHCGQLAFDTVEAYCGRLLSVYREIDGRK